MREAVLQVVCAGLGTLGFSLVFRVAPRHLPLATLGGVLSWSCYLAAYWGSGSVFFSSLVAALTICLWAEAMARVRKAPATIFLVPGIIPLLPGGALYYAMYGVVQKDMDSVLSRGSEAAFVAVGIAIGILIASEIVRLIRYIGHRRRRGKKRTALSGDSQNKSS